MSIIDSGGPNSWRQQLQPASFRGAGFFVEVGGVSSGRRTVVHEFPKRNQPYAEDMGRRAQRWPIQGYIIVSPLLPDYIPVRDELLNALQEDGPGILIHPTIRQGQAIVVMCDSFNMMESREKGGYALFEMSFVERGQPNNNDTVTAATTSQLTNAAQNAGNAAAGSLDQNLSTSPTINDPGAFLTLQQGGV